MVWINENGKAYNVSVKENGDKFWYLNNKLSREKGPAIELSAGGRVWYYEGAKIVCSNQKDFEAAIKLKKTAAEQKYYDVKIEAIVPAIFHYRILAGSPEDAANKIKSTQPVNVQYKANQRRDKKAMVYDLGTSIVRLVKNLVS